MFLTACSKQDPAAELEKAAAAMEKAAPPAAAAVVPAPTGKKPVQVIADDLTLNPVLDCFINSDGVCFYADLDEDTLDPIPDMSRIIGSIPKGKDPEEATEKDFTPA
jgi:hypothetical protein